MPSVRCLGAALVLTTSAAHAAPWPAHDKREHFVAGAAIAGDSVVLATALGSPGAIAALVGVGAGLLAGAAKEALDAVDGGDPSFGDLAWTAAGALVGAGVTCLFRELAR